MATRHQRLNEFDQSAPPVDVPLELLCEDHNGTYVLPYRCQWSEGAWRNSATGTAIEGTVMGWRHDDMDRLNRVLR